MKLGELQNLVSNAVEHIIFSLQAPIQNYIPEIAIEDAVENIAEYTGLSSDEAGMVWDALVEELDGLDYKIIHNDDYLKIVNFTRELQILPLGER